MALGSLDILQVAQSLKGVLDDFLGGTIEAPGLRCVIEFAAQEAENDRTPCEGKRHVGAERLQGSITVQRPICEHSCSEHKEVMSPVVWGALPKDLLQIVFARLPLADISRLRCLSKEWKRSLETSLSEFNQVCEAVTSTTSNSFALVTTDGDQHGVFWVRFFDMRANRWHEFEFDSEDEYCVALAACDGGSVCLLSVVPDNEDADEDDYDEDLPKPLFLTVWNLLTGEKNELPDLDDLDGFYPTMVQLVVDPQTKHYKVMVANDNIIDLGIQQGAYTYDSQSQQWSKVEKSSMVIFGISYSWPDLSMEAEAVATRPCKFDFATTQLYKLKRKVEPWGRENVRSYALTEDRLFVLDEFFTEEGVVVHRISEYHADVNPGSAQSGTTWLLEKTHSCGPFESTPICSFDLHLFAFKEFLLVCAQNEENQDSPYRHQRLWLYNISTGEWRELPNLVKYKEIDPDDIMCERPVENDLFCSQRKCVQTGIQPGAYILYIDLSLL